MAYHHYRSSCIYLKIRGDRSLRIATVLLRKTGRWPALYAVYIYSADLKTLLAEHDVTWSRRDSFCKDQYITRQPEEWPTAPVKVKLQQVALPEPDTGFEKFNFEEGLWDD
jgi:hypothetical protein